jgi:hypothetical protein
MTKPQADFLIGIIAVLGSAAVLTALAHEVYVDLNKAPIPKIEMVYDCRLAEISPDYPIVVKERCRKIMQPRVRAIG